MGFLRQNARLLVVALIALVIAGVVVRKRFAPLPVTVSAVVRGKAIDAVYATGTVEADDRVNVKAKTNGSLLEILVREGDRVKKGDLLARIDNPAVAFDLKRGQGDLAAANAQAGASAPQVAALAAQAKAIAADLDLAKGDLARSDSLGKSGSISTAEVDRARSRVAQLEAQLAANEAQQRALRIDLSANAARQAAQVQSLSTRVLDTEVRAPLDGVVLAKNVELGEVVAINQTLFKVGTIDRLVLEVSVDEADVGRVREPSKQGGNDGASCAVSLYAFPKEVFKGRVIEVLPDANRERKSFLAKVRLDAPPKGLKSGMSAEVNIVSSEKEGVLLAPTEAEIDGFVWLVESGHAHKQKVKIGIRDLLRVELTEGVNEGQLVVIEGQDKLKDDASVAPTERKLDKDAPIPDKSQPTKAAL
jgi:multidrug efflux pump subunit AcrA (membrane-fusion protein)